MSAQQQPMYVNPGPGRRAKADPDFIVVSHGEHAVLMPTSARGDRYLDAQIGVDGDEESYCDGGWRIEWPALRDILTVIRGARLTVVE